MFDFWTMSKMFNIFALKSSICLLSAWKQVYIWSNGSWDSLWYFHKQDIFILVVIIESIEVTFSGPTQIKYWKQMWPRNHVIKVFFVSRCITHRRAHHIQYYLDFLTFLRELACSCVLLKSSISTNYRLSFNLIN